jgi:hypothetical protein
MAITKKSGRQEEIVAYQTINYTDLTSVYGTAVGVTQEAIALPVGSLVLGGYLVVETALETEGVKATGVLTSTDVPHANDVVVVNTTTYKFVTALSTGPTVADEVLIGTEAVSLANLAAAINGAAGAGTLYSAGTTSQATSVVAVAAAHTLTLTAVRGGTAANAIATTTTHTHGSWAAVTLEGGASGEDTIAVKIGSAVYKTAADVTTAAAYALVPTGTVLTADDTIDVLHAVAATTIGPPIAGVLHLIVRYIVTTREEFTQGV